MSDKNGSSRLALKVGLVLAIAVAVVWGVLYRYRSTALVEAVERGPTVDAVTGSVIVHAEDDIFELKAEVGGVVASCDALKQDKKFKQGDVLVELDKTELK